MTLMQNTWQYTIQHDGDGKYENENGNENIVMMMMMIMVDDNKQNNNDAIIYLQWNNDNDRTWNLMARCKEDLVCHRRKQK